MTKKTTDTDNNVEQSAPRGSIAESRAAVVAAEAAVAAAQTQVGTLGNELRAVEREIGKLEQKLGGCETPEAIRATASELAEQRALLESLGVELKDVTGRVQRPALFRLEQAWEMLAYIAARGLDARRDLAYHLESAAGAHARLKAEQERTERDLTTLEQKISAARRTLALFDGESTGGVE